MSSVFQQVALALGVALAGFVLEAAGWFTGDTLALVNFHAAFLVSAALALVSVPVFALLPAAAGQDASGHRAPDAGLISRQRSSRRGHGPFNGT